LRLEGKTSTMTAFRILELESVGFAWKPFDAIWKQRLSELSDYHYIHGHCNVSTVDTENSELGAWVSTQRTQYNRKTSAMTAFRILELESVGFAWSRNDAIWKQRLSELSDYNDIHQHCNIPQCYPENPPLGNWVQFQREQHKKGNMTDDRSQALNSLDFAWGLTRGQRKRR
jgi:hypothetical protein